MPLCTIEHVPPIIIVSHTFLGVVKICNFFILAVKIHTQAGNCKMYNVFMCKGCMFKITVCSVESVMTFQMSLRSQ